jgi:hypothetical protein
MAVEFDFGLGWTLQMISVNAVDDIDMVTCVAQCVTQVVDKNPIPAETIGGIEGGEMKEIERPLHRLTTFCIRAIIC